jgi:hypothetical protein
MLMASTLPSKDIDWKTTLKRKILQFIVYKNPTYRLKQTLAWVEKDLLR